MNHYNNGVTGYWNNSGLPRNSIINGSWEVSNTRAGKNQSPNDAANGRFLMFWTEAGGAPRKPILYFSERD